MQKLFFYTSLVLLLTITSPIDFCQIQNPYLQLFNHKNQVQQIPLNKYIQGSNLYYSSSNDTLVQIFQPYHLVDHRPYSQLQGYTLINIDAHNPSTNQLTRKGILFAVGIQKKIAVGYGQFLTGALPNILKFNYKQLQFTGTCYSALIYNSNLDIIIDCQQRQLNQQDTLNDIICILTYSSYLNCDYFQSTVPTYQRKSIIYKHGEQSFILSAYLTGYVRQQASNDTFVNIYHIVQQSVHLTLVINRITLGLDTLSINDIDIIQLHGEDYIVLTDSSSKLVIFRYIPPATITNPIIVNVPGTPTNFAASLTGTWLISNYKYVMQCTFYQSSKSLNILRRYQLNPSDNKIVDLQSTYQFLVLRTVLNTIYTYALNQTQLKYLLNQHQLTQQTKAIISPFYPRFFLINSSDISIIAISPGYLYINKITQSTNLTINAYSAFTTCTLNINIKYIQEDIDVYQKNTFLDNYKNQNNLPLIFDLSQYFGGTNLRYKINNLSNQLNYTLQHIGIYSQQLSSTKFPQSSLSNKIIQIDPTHYWRAQFTSTQVHFYFCQLDTNQLTCIENQQQTIPSTSILLQTVDGKQSTNGKAIISWVYQNKTIGIKILGDSQIAHLDAGLQSNITQVLISQKYAIYLQKSLSRLTFYDFQKATTSTFTKANFTLDQLNQMNGFYPRSIMESHFNPQIFYIKSPISIITISYTGNPFIQILSVIKVYNTYLHDDQWEIVVGKQTLMLFTHTNYTEYATRPDHNILQLHTTLLKTPILFPVRYSLSTNTAYVQYQDNSIQYIRLGHSDLDSQYYLLNTITPNSLQNWDISGSWLLANEDQIYYQFPQPTLTIKSTLPENIDQKYLYLNLTVSASSKSINSTTHITTVNYPTKISASNVADKGVTLPEKAQYQILPFPISQYFTGCVASVKIICVYCLQDHLNLISPIQKIKQNKNMNTFEDLLALSDTQNVILLTNNSLKIINLANDQIASKKIETSGLCTSLGTTQTLVVVYCQQQGNQYLFRYQLIYTKTQILINFTSSYQIPSDAALSKPSQIGLYLSQNTTIVFIHDVDLMNPSAKQSNIKIFQLSDTIIYQGLIDSTLFHLPTFQPINSMSIYKDYMLITIGGKGLGYINILNPATNQQFIDLEHQPSLLNYNLDNTLYLRVIITQLADTTLHALVTTSNSHTYLLSFKIAQSKVFFNKIQERYHRYGHQMILNWALIDTNYVMLSFFNKSTSIESLVLYKRNTTGLIDFFISEQLIIPQSVLALPKAVLLHKKQISNLFMSSNDKPGSKGVLTLYNIISQFSLLARYNQSRSFSSMKIIASNDYYTIQRDISVEFSIAHYGVKWYSVIVTAIIVSAFIGISIFYCIKIRRKKKSCKAVSVFTENQQLDQEV